MKAIEESFEKTFLTFSTPGHQCAVQVQQGLAYRGFWGQDKSVYFENHCTSIKCKEPHNTLIFNQCLARLLLFTK